MNFMFSWQEQYLTRSLRSLVRYCSCHSNIKFISSRYRVISSIHYINTSEIPSELSRENFISSHVKRSPLLWLHNKPCLFHSHKNNMSFAWPNVLHIKKLTGMHNKETYMYMYTRMLLHSSEISELHCNQLRLATLQEELVWCRCEVITSFCLVREANSGLQN